jgi:uncharacterized protein YdaU (DUF1376 family)
MGEITGHRVAEGARKRRAITRNCAMTAQLPPFHRMPWYPRDFLAATRGWPLVARGLYHVLLDAQWDLGGFGVGTLPADEKQLQCIAAATPAEWREAWPYVEPKFPKADGGRRNARLEHHRAAAIHEFKARRKGAEATNRKRYGNRQNGAVSSASDTPGDSLSDTVSVS